MTAAPIITVTCPRCGKTLGVLVRPPGGNAVFMRRLTDKRDRLDRDQTVRVAAAGPGRTRIECVSQRHQKDRDGKPIKEWRTIKDATLDVTFTRAIAAGVDAVTLSDMHS